MEPYFLTRVYGSKKDAPWFEELQTALKTKCGAKAQLDDGFVDVWYGPSIRHQNPTTLLVAKTDEKSKGPGGELILSGQCEQELLEEATHPEVVSSSTLKECNYCSDDGFLIDSLTVNQ